jgi:hypothetical protein
VKVEAAIAPAKTMRQSVFELQNSHCEGSATKMHRVNATAGWRLDPSTVKVEPLGYVGAAAQWVLASKSPAEFTVAAQLTNIGQCLNVLGTSVQADVPATLRARVTYEETPESDLRQITTVSETAGIGSVQAPLPDIDLASLQFSVVNADGQTQAFRPQPHELTAKAGHVFLDVAKVLARMFGPSGPSQD